MDIRRGHDHLATRSIADNIRTAAFVRVNDSLALHLNDDGELNFERTFLHAGIVENLLEGCPRHAEASVVFTAGGPASGKTALTTALGLAVDAVVIDVDLIRAELPEYAQWIRERPEEAAALTHREASQIAKVALSTALRRGHNIVFDAVGGDDNGAFSSKIRAALSLGVRVRVCYATVPVELALEREAERFAATGRRVGATVVRAKHAEVSRGLANVARLPVDEIAIYDTSSEPPRLLARGQGGRGVDALEVVDPPGYASFLRKGNE